MPTYGYKDDLSVIIGHFSNFIDISDYINNFSDEHQYQYAVVNPKLGFRKVQINKTVFAIEQIYRTSQFESGKYGAHKIYHDVHYIAYGEELHYATNVDLLTIEIGYDSVNDLSLYGSSVKYHERLVKRVVLRSISLDPHT